MPVPDRKAMMQPILSVLADRKDHASTEMRDAVAAHFHLSDNDRSQQAGNSPQDRFTNEHAFALVDLQRRELITKPDRQRFVYRITARGLRELQARTLPSEDSTFRGSERPVRSGRRQPTPDPSPTWAAPTQNAPTFGAAAEGSTHPDRNYGTLRARPHEHLRGPLSTSYRPVEERATRSSRDPFPFDPEELDRKTLEHMQLQNEIARLAETAGYSVHSPGPTDPVDFDLALTSPRRRAAVIEIKTLSNTSGESKQIRLGIGQVLDYQHRLGLAGAEVEAILILDRQPAGSHWVEICDRHAITLSWWRNLEYLFTSERGTLSR